MNSPCRTTPATEMSLIIPVYNNAENIPDLLAALNAMAQTLGPELEIVFVIDGSPDRSGELLAEGLKEAVFRSQLIYHSRNFGAFSAIRTGLCHARGRYFAVMAADLQESPDLIVQFFDILHKDVTDVIFGQRMGRDDPFWRKTLANAYWALYQRIVLPDIPKGGVDVFACNQQVREAVLAIEEPNSSLIAQLFWVGYRRTFIPYKRQKRRHGESSWGLRRRLRYMLDSVFSYSDFPILLVLWIGFLGCVLTLLISTVTLSAKLLGFIDVPGYTALVLILLFFGCSILTTLGIIGCYVWRTLENTKKRPLSFVSRQQQFTPRQRTTLS